MKTNKWIILICVCTLGLTFWGCAGNIPESERLERVDDHWGESFRQARDNQILKPEAGEIVRPVFGLDGKAGESALKKYHGQFEGETESSPGLTSTPDSATQGSK
jgi:hypothetical protein